jgi:hypothetical protein
MLINFGDNRNGNGAEEPANQEGSLASADIYIPEELKTPEPQQLWRKQIRMLCNLPTTRFSKVSATPTNILSRNTSTATAAWLTAYTTDVMICSTSLAWTSIRLHTNITSHSALEAVHSALAYPPPLVGPDSPLSNTADQWRLGDDGVVQAVETTIIPVCILFNG